MQFTKTLLSVAIFGFSLAACQSPTSNVPSTSPQQDATKGFEAFNRGDYQTAFRYYKPLAEQGYPSAQFNLAMMYSFGKGVKQDAAEAAKWYRKAADQGSYQSQLNLGLIYFNAKNYNEAVKWFDKSAQQGHAKAQLNLGAMYYYGLGVKSDEKLAKYWIATACKNGHTKACEHYKTLFR